MSFKDKQEEFSNPKTMFMTSILTALSLVVGLFWLDVIKLLIEEIMPANEGLLWKFISAIIVTVLVFVIATIIMRSVDNLEKVHQRVKSQRISQRH
jgi:biotin transporter BioY